MFDLFKDVQKYKGVPPYASELYGLYQPLLGWQSKLTKKWVQKGGPLVDPRIKRILDAHIKPAPEKVNIRQNGVLESMLADPLEPGSGRYPYTVLLTKDLGSELLEIMRDRVQTFVNQHDGRLPQGAEWRPIVDFDDLMNEETGALRIVNDRHFKRLKAEALHRAPQGQLTADLIAAAQKTHLEVMQYESQIAGFLAFHTSENPQYPPDDLKKLFMVKKATPLAAILQSPDPLASVDPNDKSGALSPVGFVHLFRQFFFDLGTFVGEPVEHVWLAPGTTIELVEVSTRRQLVERMTETLTEMTTRAERSATTKDEISDAVKEENANSTKFGVSQTNTVNLYVYQGTVSANLGIESTRKSARETTHKQNHEQTEKLANELKQTFKSTFKTVTETTDMRSRRHVIVNPSTKLVNYELRRKMRRVGVQVQDIGARLCWQVFVDDPGVVLGLSELVHLVESPDLSHLKEPEKLPIPTTVSKKFVVPFPFKPVLDYYKNDVQYEFNGHAAGDPAKPFLGRIKADPDDDDQEIVIEHPFKFDPPQTGYVFNGDIRMVGVQGGKLAILRETALLPGGATNIVMQRVNFSGENFVNLEFELFFNPTNDEIKRIADHNAALQAKYDEEKRRATRKAFLEAVRARINAASEIKARPSWDLREEERTVVYRKLIRRLMLDSWNLPDDETNRRLSHVRSEIIRSIFDVESMLYFVAPEWWMPRRHGGRLSLKIDLNDPTSSKPFSLTDEDQVSWGGESRPDNYSITESSAAARLGSSLGWLLQLDGDNLRNAFLNAPWVKAVLPIRPGREKAALNWLRAIEGHENDGWDAPYLGTEPQYVGKQLGAVLDLIAAELEDSNSQIEPVLKADKVYETGFSHLQGGFAAGLDPNEVFSQWISVVPTDQIVAAEYEPTELFSPEA